MGEKEVIKTVLSDNVVVFSFKMMESVYVNISVISNGDEFILIDTGFPQYIQYLSKFYDFDKCKAVILTHFHADHMFGLLALPAIPIIGSKNNQTDIDTMKPYFEGKGIDFDKFTPTQLVDKELEIDFHGKKIQVIENPGHTQSSVIIKYDNDYVFTGDELLYTVDDKNLTPYHWTDSESILNSYNVLRDII